MTDTTNAHYDTRMDETPMLGVPASLWNDMKSALATACRDLDDASSVVDPGEDEEVAYQSTLSLLKQINERIDNTPPVEQTPATIVIATNSDDRISAIDADKKVRIIVMSEYLPGLCESDLTEMFGEKVYLTEPHVTIHPDYIAWTLNQIPPGKILPQR